MNKVQNAITAIADLTQLEEIRAVEAALRMKKEYLARATLTVGDTVSFDRGPRRGGMISGKVTKINTKTVKVQTNAGIWNVGIGLLNRSETAAA